MANDETVAPGFVVINVRPDVHNRIRTLAARKKMKMYEVVERSIDLLENQIGWEQPVGVQAWDPDSE